MKGGSVSGVCKGYITKVVWRAILALMGAWGPHKLVISDTVLNPRMYFRAEYRHPGMILANKHQLVQLYCRTYPLFCKTFV